MSGTRSHRLVSTLALAMSGVLAFAPIARAEMTTPHAQQTQDQKAGANTNQAKDDQGDMTTKTGQGADAFYKTSQDGLKVVREVTLARAALEEGESDLAGKLVSHAITALKAGEADAATLPGAAQDHAAKSADGSQDKAGGAGSQERWLPLQVSVFVAEDLQPGTAPQSGSQADQPAKSGTAPDTSLRVAASEEAVSAVLLPVTSTMQHLEAAQTSIQQDKAQDADRALQAISETVIFADFGPAAQSDGGSTVN